MRTPYDDLGDVLRVEADGPVRTVVLDRSEELNALSRKLHWGLANVWRMLSADTEARVVILTGAGRSAMPIDRPEALAPTWRSGGARAPRSRRRSRRSATARS